MNMPGNAGAVRWLALVITAVCSIALLGAGLTWSASGRDAIAGSVVDFTPHGTQPGLTHQLEDHAACSGCHASWSPGTGPTAFMPYNTWSGSMMAQSMRDPLFWAALDVANADIPGVGDYCLRCHTPQGWLDGRVSKTTIGTVVNGANGCLLEGTHDAAYYMSPNDYSGVGCHFCHRLTETGPNGEIAPPGSGNFWLDDNETCENSQGTQPGPCRYGPYDYAVGDTRVPPGVHTWKYSAFHDRGAVCGVCHDVTTPITSAGPAKTLILADGSDSGIPMPLERTFSEWRHSDFADVIFRNRMGDDFGFTPQLERGATCQDCHMANSPDPLATACNQNDPGSRAGNLPVHEFVGGNTWIPPMIRDLYAANIGDTTAEALDRTVDLARYMLSERSATVETAASLAAPGQLGITVKVTNLAGHKLPTGYAEGRRMWLHVVARDAGNNVVWENGYWNPATGELSEDAQTRVYETLQGIWNPTTQTCDIVDGQGRKQFHFVLNNCIAKDNRIPPLGFTGGGNLEIRPVGLVYPPAAPGSSALANHDIVTYTAPLPGGFSGALTVTATLRFQLASDDYIHFLKNQADERGFQGENLMCANGPGRPFTVGPQGQTRGAFLFDLWNNPAYGRSPPEDMASASASLVVP